MRDGYRHLILGMTGSGKSTLLARLTRSQKRLLVYDQHQESPISGVRTLSSASLLRGELAERSARPFRLGFVPPANDPEHFDFVCNLVRAARHCCFVVDEVDTFVTSHSMPMPFRWLYGRGRKFGITLICVARRPQEIHPYMRSQTTRWWVGQTREPQDLKYLERVLGVEAAARAPVLPRGQFLTVVV